MSANFQVESQGKEHKYHYDGAWNRDKINFDSNLKLIQGWSNFELTANLQSPFEVCRGLMQCWKCKFYGKLKNLFVFFLRLLPEIFRVNPKAN